MSKVPLSLSLPGDVGKNLPSYRDDRPEIQRLFERAARGELPRNRPLKPWEPLRLNERHLAIVMMRSGGAEQNAIARVFGLTPSNVSIVLNHPDALFLLSHLQAMRATQPTDAEARLASLSGPALDVIEEVLSDPELPAVKKSRTAFDILRMNGHGSPKPKAPQEVVHRFEASPAQVDALTKALHAVAQPIDEEQYVLADAANEVRSIAPPEGGDFVSEGPGSPSGSPADAPLGGGALPQAGSPGPQGEFVG